MFKSWRNDKKKIKATFKLQFQATQVPHLKKPALIVSLVPEDVGKTTFKLEKAAVQEGICSWENPVYVTVKLVKEPKSGKLHEKIYHFIVSSGSSKSGYLGEASIDFADFADETEPLTVSLPLKFANSGAVLHVTIQKMQADAGQRKIEANEDPILTQDGSLKNQLSNTHTDDNNGSLAEDRDLEYLSSQNSEQDTSFRSSNGGNCGFKSILREDSIRSKGTADPITSKNHWHRRSSTDWSLGSVSDGSLADSTNSPEENLARELEEVPDESVDKLKSEIANLMRQSELAELELQSLRKQITKESRRGQDLSMQIIDLKEERDALKIECEKLKSSEKCVDGGESRNILLAENEDSRIWLEEMERELSHQKELNANLKLQLQKTQESNSELILAVQDLDEILEQKNTELSLLSSKLDEVQEKKCQCSMEEDAFLQPPPVLEEQTREQTNDDELCKLEQRIIDLSDEMEVYRENREKLENYIEQLTQDYEDLKQENHEISSKLEKTRLQEHRSLEYLATTQELEAQVQRLEEKLKKQTQEFSDSLASINELETKVKGLEKELEKQAQGFENDLNAMTCARIEQEQRAIRAEENLRKTRWKNAITAERLQEEFKNLSMEMASRFDENEKQTMKSITEANELRLQNKILEENLQKANAELALMKEENSLKMEELSTQLDLKTKHIEQMSKELTDTSKQLKCGGEMQDAFSMEIQMLKDEIEILRKEKNEACEREKEVKQRDETDEVKRSFEETKMLTERWKREKDELEERFAMVEKEAENMRQELLMLRSLKDERQTTVKSLSSEVERLRDQQIELKRSLSEEKREKEKVQQQILKLKEERQKKEWECTSAVKKLAVSDKMNSTSTNNVMQVKYAETVTENVRDSENRNIGENLLHSVERKVKPCSKEELKANTFHAREESNLTELLTEMALLKERNKCMEIELKEMEERYSEISLKFAEVEGERQQLVMTVRNLKNGKRS